VSCWSPVAGYRVTVTAVSFIERLNLCRLLTVVKIITNSDSENRIVKHNFSVRRRFQNETGIRLAFHATVKEAHFWGIKGCYNNDKITNHKNTRTRRSHDGVT
jgi:hypothetical protein